MSFDAYKIAVKLSLVNGISAGLLPLMSHMQALGGHVSGVQKQLSGLELQIDKIKRLGLIGGGMAAAGGFGLALFAGPLEEAKKFQLEVAKFSSLGFGDKTNQDAVKFAKGMDTIGTSARDNMALVGDAMAVFKDLGEAKMAAPLMAKMKFANEVMYGAGGGEHDKKLMDMMKVVEFRGGTSSPEEFAKQANFAQQAIAGSLNRVDPSAMLQALKTGGVALSRRSNEAFYLGAEPLLQEFGGSRYGTAAMSIYQNLVQSRGTITAQQELMRLGLLDSSKVEFNSLGKLKKALPGAFIGSGILENEGELSLLEKVLLPAFAKKGITSEKGVLQELGMILGNRTGSSLMARIYQQRAKLHTQTDANYHAENLDQAATRAAQTAAGKEIELHKKWATLMNELGTTILPIAIRGLEGLTSMVKGAINLAQEFPLLTKGVMIAFGSIAALVAAGGTVMLMSSAFSALGLALSVVGGGAGALALGAASPIIAGIAAFGAAVAGIAWIFDHFKPDSKDGGSGIHRGGGTGHAGQVWIPGHARGGVGGHWENQGADSTATSTFIKHPMSGGRTQVHATIVMPDGKVLAKVVSDAQSKDMRMAGSAGGSSFDPTRAVPTAAVNYAR